MTTYSYESRLRESAIRALGGKCVACGTDEIVILEIDHISGGGSAERRTNRRGYLRQIVMGLRHDEFQILCANDHRRVTHERKA